MGLYRFSLPRVRILACLPALHQCWRDLSFWDVLDDHVRNAMDGQRFDLSWSHHSTRDESLRLAKLRACTSVLSTLDARLQRNRLDHLECHRVVVDRIPNSGKGIKLASTISLLGVAGISLSPERQDRVGLLLVCQA